MGELVTLSDISAETAQQKFEAQRVTTALVLETPPLSNLETLIDDLREERIQSQLS